MPAFYLSPGVYVEEVPSAVRPIAGVGTSTAAFLGLFAADTVVPFQALFVNEIAAAEADKKTVLLRNYPVRTDGGFEVLVNGTKDAGAALANDDAKQQSKATLSADAPDGAVITLNYQGPPVKVAASGQVVACTSFGDFTRAFGDFSLDVGQRRLAHAVYGFFNNGGTRCFVVRVKQDTEIAGALNTLAAIDEIALVAAPGIPTARDAVLTHCRVRTGDRFALLESDEDDSAFDISKLKVPGNSDYAAFYFPWIRVFDPVTKTQTPSGDGLWLVPPTGHVAGVYARVDTERGVHKAPANEVVFGALGLRPISKAQQDALNPSGINCIRNVNGNIRIWGARTMGGDANTEFKYVNVRRLFLFLRKSIDLGTQWVVFEPNEQALWAKITRNVSAFLFNVWRSGALFGATPEQAFYVRCDAETNPPSVRDAGQVVTEIGVAVVKPAEFVIFRISQWGGPGK